VRADAGTRTVRVRGSVAAVEQAFQVRLLNYTHLDDKFRGRIGDVHLPAALAGIVQGVFGLDTRRVVERRPTQRILKSAKAATAKKRAWFFPSELAKIYSFPAGDGSGQTVAILEFGGGYFPADMQAFCKLAGIATPPKVTTISIDKASTSARDGAEGEVMLDVQVVGGVCPKATLAVYFGHFSEQGWINTLSAAIHDQTRNAPVISVSWGYAEDFPGAWTVAAVAAVDEVLKEAALLGKTICVAAGDDGSGDGVKDGHAHVDFPAASEFVLSVGGTAVKVSKTKVTEVAWKDGTGVRPSGGSTGGGVSVRIARPTWQNVTIPSVNPGPFVGRVVPDVAADASGKTGYVSVSDGQAGVVGGTSAAAPLWAALITLINAQLPAGKSVGYLTPVLYKPAGTGTVGSTTCTDITSGNNSTAVVGGYKALPGFDAVTGWGSPIGAKLLAKLQTLV
jgi:kumamolisin